MTNVQKFTEEALIRCVEESISTPHHNLYICVPENAYEQLNIIDSVMHYYYKEIMNCLEPEHNECFLILKSSSSIFLTDTLYDAETILTYSNFLCVAEDSDIKLIEKYIYNAAFESGEFVEPAIIEFYNSFEIVDEVE